MSALNFSKIIVLIFIFTLLCASNTQAQRIFITNARILSMQETLENEYSSMLIENGVVQSINNSKAIPPGSVVIDAEGTIITPGLFDPHTQIGLEEIDAVDSSVNSRLTNEHVAPAFDIQYAVNFSSTLMRINLVEGVTHAVAAPAPGSDFFAGFGSAIQLSTTPSITNPRIGLFASINDRITKKIGGSTAEVISKLRRTLANLRASRSSRYKPDPGQYGKIDMAAIDQASQNFLPFIVEVNRANEILQLITVAREFNLNLVIMGGAEAWKVKRQLSEAAVPVILDPLDNLPSNFNRLGARLDNAAILDSAGINLSFSDPDSHNSRRLRQLAGNAVTHGLPWHKALMAITRNPANLYKLDSGQLKNGEQASFVIWSGDPLELSTWPERIFTGGAWINSESRQTALYRRYLNLDSGKEKGFSYQ
jgi:imidazolonepropionase-like amidohydrolase